MPRHAASTAHPSREHVRHADDVRSSRTAPRRPRSAWRRRREQASTAGSSSSVGRSTSSGPSSPAPGGSHAANPSRSTGAKAAVSPVSVPRRRRARDPGRVEQHVEPVRREIERREAVLHRRAGPGVDAIEHRARRPRRGGGRPRPDTAAASVPARSTHRRRRPAGDAVGAAAPRRTTPRCSRPRRRRPRSPSAIGPGSHARLDGRATNSVGCVDVREDRSPSTSARSSSRRSARPGSRCWLGKDGSAGAHGRRARRRRRRVPGPSSSRRPRSGR